MATSLNSQQAEDFNELFELATGVSLAGLDSYDEKRWRIQIISKLFTGDDCKDMLPQAHVLAIRQRIKNTLHAAPYNE